MFAVDFARLHIRGLMKIARFAKEWADNTSSKTEAKEYRQTVQGCVTCARRWNWRLLDAKRKEQ